MSDARPILALTQGDPAGIGPEIILAAVEASAGDRWTPLLVAERAALEVTPAAAALRDRLVFVGEAPDRAAIEDMGDCILVLDPVSEDRTVVPGESGPADAAGAMAVLDAALDLALDGRVDALVTAPVSKASIARQHLPGFRGHTDYLARRCGLERYGRDYLMAFLTPRLQVALLTVHQPLRRAIEGIEASAIEAALECLGRYAGGRIAVAGLNPHAGEGGLLGSEDDEIVRPAVERARARGLDASGPESADSLFARAAGGEFDWVLALYHDQGLIAVKTAGFGESVNWTLGLPVLRTSVDHGTAFEIAGTGTADARPIVKAVEVTLGILDGSLPRGGDSSASC